MPVSHIPLFQGYARISELFVDLKLQLEVADKNHIDPVTYEQQVS